MTIAGGQTLNGRGPIAVEHHTADFTLSVDECGTLHTNKGASGTISGQLPAATVGLHYRFAVRAAQQLRVEPNGTEVISLPSNGVEESAGDYIVADAIGETVHIICTETGHWSVFGYTGTWTGQ